MKFLITLLLIVLTVPVFAQKKLQKKINETVEEGKLLHRIETASWFGTDLLMANYTDISNIGGNISYPEGDLTRCVFFDRSTPTRTICTFTFSENFSNENTTMNFDARALTKNEKELVAIRKVALENMQTNKDDFYTFYKDCSPNLVPLKNGKNKKVYIITAPTVEGVVILGNDYLLTFNKKNGLKSRKALHQNLISIPYQDTENGEERASTMHSHSKKTGELITATDICTLLLYSNTANWRMHYVVSPNYLNIWSCEEQNLMLLPRKFLNKENATNQENKEKE